MQQNFDEKGRYILSILISGSHFTAAVFDHITRTAIPGSYLRVPVSHRAGVKVVTGIWEQCIDLLISKIKDQVIACCVAVPAAFDPGKKSMLSENYQLYPFFRQFDFKSFFVLKLGISHDMVYLVSPASALLANEQHLNGSLANRLEASMFIGTDITGASSLDGFATDLQWEFKIFKGHYANSKLSIQWVCKRYHQLTGISILNLDQFMQIGKTSNIAKTVLKDYLNNLIDFLCMELPLNQLNTIYISGDLVLVGSMLKSMFLKRDITADVKFVRSEQLSLLAGAVLLGYFGMEHHLN